MIDVACCCHFFPTNVGIKGVVTDVQLFKLYHLFQANFGAFHLL